ncbi:MAG TPA: hypothetical protein VFA12_06425 [Stellaceae bacterium]|nr:hypothetical protein [Stellaceae bacterium]
MPEPISAEEFKALAERAGLTRLAPERLEELRQGCGFLQRMQRSVRRPRDRAAEPAHIFVPKR